MDPIIIRCAMHEDAAALLAVHQAAIRVLGRGAYTERECESWVFGLTQEGYVRAMEAGETFICAVFVETVVAFCSYQDSEILGLFVHPKWSRKRIATKLLSTAEKRIFQSGGTKIALDAAASAVPFYQANGYRVEYLTPWPTRGGLCLTSYRMSKDS